MAKEAVMEKTEKTETKEKPSVAEFSVKKFDPLNPDTYPKDFKQKQTMFAALKPEYRDKLHQHWVRWTDQQRVDQLLRMGYLPAYRHIVEEVYDIGGMEVEEAARRDPALAAHIAALRQGKVFDGDFIVRGDSLMMVCHINVWEAHVKEKRDAADRPILSALSAVDEVAASKDLSNLGYDDGGPVIKDEGNAIKMRKEIAKSRYEEGAKDRHRGSATRVKKIVEFRG